MKATKGADASTPEAIARHLDEINKTLTNISFGGSAQGTAPAVGQSRAVVDGDMNFDGHKIIATSPAAPNTEFAVAHPLGRIPAGFVFLGGSNPGHVYRGATAWTKTQIFLKESQGSNTFQLLIV